jgi:hypothetical protein
MFAGRGLTGCYEQFNLATTQLRYDQAGSQNSLRIRHLAAFILCFRYALKLATIATTLM